MSVKMTDLIQLSHTINITTTTLCYLYLPILNNFRFLATLRILWYNRRRQILYGLSIMPSNISMSIENYPLVVLYVFLIKRETTRCLINIQNVTVHIVLCVQTDLEQFIKLLKHMCSSSIRIGLCYM